jgi:hypothetical protein
MSELGTSRGKRCDPESGFQSWFWERKLWMTLGAFKGAYALLVLGWLFVSPSVDRTNYHSSLEHWPLHGDPSPLLSAPSAAVRTTGHALTPDRD